MTLVHGIGNLQKGMSSDRAATLLAGAARPKLELGLRKAGLAHVAIPELVMAYYADLLADGMESQSGAPAGGLESLSPAELSVVWEWLLAMGVPEPEEPQAAWLAPVRQGMAWLIRTKGGAERAQTSRAKVMDRLERVVCALIQEVDTYTSRPQTRAAARARVAGALQAGGGCQVVVAHSLGSVVAYETLHAFPEIKVELLVTLGSPLGLPALSRTLEPALQYGKGARPPGVGRWVNIADVGDLVALPPELGGLFAVDAHHSTDIGLFDPHTLGAYLSNGMAAAAIAAYLQD
ncbi:hypothetical protein ACFWDI_34205 [Streptomyces sp. NPDC060064]|uniref:hypothetical protein n=1 Tax=Streptomyces sp. NPDC060064 TaxID=3347049 RepID=UPI003695DB87